MVNPVECHSGHEYAERPIAVHWDGKRCQIEAVIAEWRTPEGKGFLVLAENGYIFRLFYNQDIDNWKIEETD
jgi:hypothetical protein